MVKPLKDVVQVEVKTRQDLRSWLESHHTQAEGIWLVTYKKNSPHYLPTKDIVRECLCFGWIDSLPRKLDDTKTMLYISPRKQGSNWSKVNKEYVAQLQQEGMLHPSGLQKIEEAKLDGSWSFLDDVEALILPEDLRQAFAQNQTAYGYWEAFPRSVKRGILEWIKNAKRPATRAKRIQQTVTKAANNIRANY